MPSHSPAVVAAVRIANRHLAGLADGEREQVLTALVEVGEPVEADAANEVLFHERKTRAAQLTLRAILDGVGKPAA